VTAVLVDDDVHGDGHRRRGHLRSRVGTRRFSRGFNIDPQTLANGADAVARRTGTGELPHTVEFLLNIIPTSIISAFAENQLLQVLFFAVLFGLALAKFGEHGPPVVFELIEHFSDLFFTIIGWITRLAPLAAFGAMAYLIGQYGISSLGSYAKLIGACYLGAALFILVLAAIARFIAGVNLWRFVVYIKDELFLALGTASTEVVLPRIMDELMFAGCSRTTTGLVVPTGYSFNLDGATLSVDLCPVPVPGAGARRGTQHRGADHRRPGAHAYVEGHGRGSRLVILRAVGDGGRDRARRDPGGRGRAAAGRRSDHGLDAGIGESSRQLRGDHGGSPLEGSVRQPPDAKGVAWGTDRGV
jgi:hypothetical protein